MKTRNFALMLMMSVVFLIQSISVALPHSCCGDCNTQSAFKSTVNGHRHSEAKAQSKPLSCCATTVVKKVAEKTVLDQPQSAKSESKCKCTISSGIDLQVKKEQPLLLMLKDLVVANLAQDTFSLPTASVTESTPILSFSDSSPPHHFYDSHLGRAPPVIS